MSGWGDRIAPGRLPDGMGALFAAMVGASSEPSSGPFTHTWSPGEPTSVTIVGHRRRVRVVAHGNARRMPVLRWTSIMIEEV